MLKYQVPTTNNVGMGAFMKFWWKIRSLLVSPLVTLLFIEQPGYNGSLKYQFDFC